MRARPARVRTARGSRAGSHGSTPSLATRAGLARAAALLALASLAFACANETIYLARIPQNDSGVPTAPQRCVDSSTCPTGYYCDLPACGALSGGTCQLPPPACDPGEDPHCGCDQITYFNDCYRRVSGVSSSTRGPCLDFGLPCGLPIPGGAGGTAMCPEGALCAELGGFVHDACDHPIPGTCWVLPANCATTTPSDYWDSCDGAGRNCLDTCDAIREGGAYRRSQKCP